MMMMMMTVKQENVVKCAVSANHGISLKVNNVVNKAKAWTSKIRR